LIWDGWVAQLLVRNLNESVKEALHRRAQRHGRSMEEAGLGSQIAALFSGAELDEPIGEWRGQEAAPAAWGS